MGAIKSLVFFFKRRRRHTRYMGDWSSDVCSSDLKGDNFLEKVPATNAPGQIFSAQWFIRRASPVMKDRPPYYSGETGRENFRRVIPGIASNLGRIFLCWALTICFAIAFSFYCSSDHSANDCKHLAWVASYGSFSERVSRGSRPLFFIFRGCDLRWWRDCRITGPRADITRSDVDDLNPQADDGSQPPIHCGGGF